MGFTGGFLTAIGGAAKQKADAEADAQHQLRQQKADMYWKVVLNPDSQKAEVDEANAQLDKLYPKGPAIKQLFDKFRQAHGMVHPSAQDPQQSGAPQGGGVPPPPQAPGSANIPPGKPGDNLGPQGAAAPTATSSIATPAFNPNAGSAVPQPPAKPSFADLAHRAAGPSTAEQDKRHMDLLKQQQDLVTQDKIAIEEAKAKAKAQAGPTGNPPRPVFSRPTSVLDARGLAGGGKVYEGEDSEPIDVEKLPDNMSLQPFTTRIIEEDEDGNKHAVWKTRYLPISPDQREITVGGKKYAVNPADASKITQGAGTDIGAAVIPSVKKSTDPATNQTTTSTTTPQVTGAVGRGAGPMTSGGGTTPPTPKPAATPQVAPSAKSVASPSTAVPPAPKGMPPLDPDGHITTGGSPQVIEGANQLLDGSDKDKLPAKTRELSAKLARAYGWAQGKFTPKEQVMLRESTTFIDEALSNPAYKVLDESWLDRQKIAQVVDSVDSKGMISRGITTLAAKSMTPNEAEFVRSYNQLVGTISGLGQLVRSGRATEATIERLKKELPNPVTTKDSADAKARLTRLRKEIDVALEKGQFTGTTTAGPKSTVPRPPTPRVDQGTLSPAAREYLKSQGIAVP